MSGLGDRRGHPDPLTGAGFGLSVSDLAERIADYLETSMTYDSWSKRDCAIEAVRIACEDAPPLWPHRPGGQA